MRSSKSRSRNKSNRNNNRPSGNIVNRVFDSSGPEGKVRGTPQQIIDKYNQLARDAQLSGDRVATENFQQHSEHYTRMLAEAQREQEARRLEQERQREQQQARREEQQKTQQVRQDDRRSDRDDVPGAGDQPAPLAIDGDEEQATDSTLVETPEAQAPKQRRPRTRKPAPQPDAPEAAE